MITVEEFAKQKQLYQKSVKTKDFELYKQVIGYSDMAEIERDYHKLKFASLVKGEKKDPFEYLQEEIRIVLQLAEKYGVDKKNIYNLLENRKLREGKQ